MPSLYMKHFSAAVLIFPRYVFFILTEDANSRIKTLMSLSVPLVLNVPSAIKDALMIMQFMKQLIRFSKLICHE